MCICLIIFFFGYTIKFPNNIFKYFNTKQYLKLMKKRHIVSNYFLNFQIFRTALLKKERVKFIPKATTFT